MKKALFIGLLVVLVLVVVVVGLGAAGLAYAQSNATPTPDPGTGPGMMDWGNMMRGWRSDSHGPLHTYMVEALTSAFDLTPEEVQAHLDGEKTLWQIAQDKGFTVEEFRALMVQARTDALKRAVADGVITQEQADWMSEHMNRMWANGYGPGNGHCGGFGARRIGGSFERRQ